MWDIVLPALLALCTARLGYLGMQLTLHPPQTVGEKAAYKFAFIIVGALSICIIIWQGTRNYSTQEEAERVHNSENEAQRKVVQSAQNELRELRTQLANESARRTLIEQEMANKAELEKKHQAEIYAKRESARRNREKNFVIPFQALINKAYGSIRMMNESFFDTKHFREEALAWLNAMLVLLEEHCSNAEVVRIFKYPHREAGIPGSQFSTSWDKRFKDEYPYIINPDWVRFAAFYRLRIEDLEKQDLSDCK